MAAMGMISMAGIAGLLIKQGEDHKVVQEICGTVPYMEAAGEIKQAEQEQEAAITAATDAVRQEERERRKPAPKCAGKAIMRACGKAGAAASQDYYEAFLEADQHADHRLIVLTQINITKRRMIAQIMRGWEMEQADRWEADQTSEADQQEERDQRHAVLKERYLLSEMPPTWLDLGRHLVHMGGKLKGLPMATHTWPIGTCNGKSIDGCVRYNGLVASRSE